MKVWFTKTEIGKHHVIDRCMRRGLLVKSNGGFFRLGTDDWMLLKNIIRKNFDSVIFKDTSRMFIFDDEADDAYFQVWSCDGIEL